MSGIKGLIAPVIGDLEPSSMPRRVVKAEKLGVETFLMKHSVGTRDERVAPHAQIWNALFNQ